MSVTYSNDRVFAGAGPEPSTSVKEEDIFLDGNIDVQVNFWVTHTRMRQENILRQCIFLLNEKKKFQFPKGILLIFQIRNIVCNYSLPMHIDLRQLASRSYNVFYDRGKGVCFSVVKLFSNSCFRRGILSVINWGNNFKNLGNESPIFQFTPSFTRRIVSLIVQKVCWIQMDVSVIYRNYKLCILFFTQ